MITLERSLPINRASDTNTVTREQVWAALRMKARNGLPFVPVLTQCRALWDGDKELLREVAVSDGPTFLERVTFHGEKLAVFEHITGSQRSVVLNLLESDDRGEVHLTYTFLLEFLDVEADGEEEMKRRVELEERLPYSVDATLDAVHRLVSEGKL